MNTEYIRLCSIPAVQEKIREGMGKPKIGDLFMWIDSEIDFIKTEFQIQCVVAGNGYTVFPQAIDWQNPERGLEGMIESANFHHYSIHYFKNIFPNYSITLYGNKRGNKQFNGDTLELALMKALMWQWGIEEVKG